MGVFPKKVQGLEINPVAVDYCKAAGIFPVADGAHDACVLDTFLFYQRESVEISQAILSGSDVRKI